MEDGIQVRLTEKEWEFTIRSLEDYMKSKEFFLKYQKKERDAFDKLLKKLKGERR